MLATRILLICAAMWSLSLPMCGQVTEPADTTEEMIQLQDSVEIVLLDTEGSEEGEVVEPEDSVAGTDSISVILLQSRVLADSLARSTQKVPKVRRIPDPKRALWLALILPGAGQIYNGKYWKLPIIYGGFIGCTYALLWNQQMYSDYSQAYLDIMDDDPSTASYEKILPLGYDITGLEEEFQKIFKRKKDRYRRYRDLSIFAFIGVYIISVIDAYVDAQLSSFDISKDLSLEVEPVIIDQNSTKHNQSVGVQCSFNF